MAIDWWNLSKDLVEAIGEKLYSYADYLRYRAVCVEWNSSLPNKPRGLQPQKYPYLLLPPPRSELPHRRLLNPLDGNVVDHLELPEAARDGEGDKWYYRGFSKGWLIAIEKEGISIHLINTFPSAHDDHHRLLPPITTFPDVLEYRPDQPGEEFLLSSGTMEGGHGFISDTRISDFDELHVFFIQKVVLSCPPTETNCIAMAMYGEFQNLAYCKYGGEAWTRVGGIGPTEGSYTDIIFYQDKFYAIDGRRQVKVIVVSNLDSSPIAVATLLPKVAPNPHYTENLYLVVVDHNLFMLSRHVHTPIENGLPYRHPKVDLSACSYATTEFELLFKLNLNCNTNSNQHGNWSRKKMSKILDKHVLFLGWNESLALPSHIFPQCNGGRIYFCDDGLDEHTEEVEDRGSDFGVFNILNKTVQPLHGYEQRQLLWPPPIWVMRLNYC